MPAPIIWWNRIAENTTLPDLVRLLNWRVRPVDSGGLAVCEIHIDGGGATITTGIKLDIPFPDYACTITGWEMVADQSTTTVIDLWHDTYANYPPTVADTITAAAKPTITAALKNRALSVPTWPIAGRKIAKGDTIRVNVDSNNNAQRITLGLSLQKE